MEAPARHVSLLAVAPDGTERVFVLGAAAVTIGRGHACDVVLDDPLASRRHARLTVEGLGARVEDLGSTHGTHLDGRRLTAPAALADGSRLGIGRTELRFVDPRAPREAAAPEDPSARETRLSDALATGVLGRTLVAGTPEGLESPEADAALLRVVVTASAGPRLVVRDRSPTREIPLAGRAFVVGRSPASDLALDDPEASASHARVSPTDRGWLVEDLGSRNGTSVNGVAVPSHVLREGDAVRIGSSLLVFKDDSARTDAGPRTRRPVVVVPGFGGSELSLGGERLWPNLPRLFACSERRLREYWAEAEVGSVIREVAIVPGLFKLESFGRLLAYLESELGYRHGEDLLEFPFDWRRDCRHAARALAQAVATWRSGRARPTEKVVVVAHSMGGLVARHFLACLGGADAVERAVFLGTPHHGSTRSLLVVTAGRRTRPLGLVTAKLQQILKGLPSLYQLLPRRPAADFDDGSPLEPLAGSDWVDPECRAHLDAAVAFRGEIDAAPPGVPVTSVFGYGRRTVERLRLRRGAGGVAELVAEEYTTAGDGTVAEASAVLEGSEIHPVEQEHGSLHADRDVLRRLRFELTER